MHLNVVRPAHVRLSQVLIQVLFQEPKAGIMNCLAQEITKYVLKNKLNAPPNTIALSSSPHLQACEALTLKLTRNANLDVTVLYRNYSSSEPPLINLIRNP